MTLRIGTRPGALEHMTMSQYHAMKKDPKHEHCVILLTDHKCQVDGPAVISLTEELKQLLDTYVNGIKL